MGFHRLCLGEVSDLSETSPRRLGEVSGKSRTSLGSLGEVVDVSGKSRTSLRQVRDVSDLSRGSRGRLGEVRVMEFGFKGHAIWGLNGEIGGVFSSTFDFVALRRVNRTRMSRHV